MFLKIWNSATLMTMASFASRSLSFLVVLPIILTRLSTPEISLWYLFETIISFQMLVDIGFSPTFSRIIAYAMGGRETEELLNLSGRSGGSPNRVTLGAICGTMRYLYRRLSLVWFLLLAVVGTISLIRPISMVADPHMAWAAWVTIIAISGVTFYGNFYSSFLQGVNEIAILRRWEAITSLIAIPSMGIVLLLGGGLVGLVLTHQFWQCFNVMRNRFLARKVLNGYFSSFRESRKNNIIFSVTWPSAWRSGIGQFMSYGLVHGSGIVFAQFGSPAAIATYLLALRFFLIISRFSQAPFYSKLPLLSRLYAEGKQQELVNTAAKGMRMAYWIYLAGFIGLGLFGRPLLQWIGSNAVFPEPIFWQIMGIGFFIERYGAMHIQFFSTTNCIIWHVANGVTGVIYVASAVFLFPIAGIYAFPIALIVGYGGFYAWYSAAHAYRHFKLRVFDFEKRVALAPFCCIVIYSGIQCYLH